MFSVWRRVLILTAAVALMVCLLGRSVPLTNAQTNSQADAPQSLRGFDLSSLNRDAQACQDFNQFADGGWIAKNPVPPAYSRWGNFEKLSEQNQEALHQILEGLVQNKSLAK